MDCLETGTVGLSVMVSGSSTSAADFRGSALSFSLATIGDDVPLAGNGGVALLASGGVVPLTNKELFVPLAIKKGAE